MDNITHTLVGACLAEAGLKRRTALGAATLMIGANFPDIDVIAVPLNLGIEWRRGMTHGFLALAILPFVLAAIMLVCDTHIRRRREPTLPPADFRQLTILSAIAIATHPTLDFMNTYGTRWLMPFVDKWFYADGLFIVDLWLFVALTLGMIWSRRAKATRPARVALGFLTAYTTLMLIITGTGRMRVAQAFPGRRFMVEPNGAIPWRRDVLVEEAQLYRMGTYSLFGSFQPGPQSWPKAVRYGTDLVDADSDPAIQRAKENGKVRSFLGWARFPMFNVFLRGGQTVVTVSDARYEGAAWASVEVALP